MDSLKLERLGQAVAEVSDALDATEGEAHVQAKLLRQLEATAVRVHTHGRPSKYAFVAASLVVCVVTLALWFGGSYRSDEPISFSEGSELGVQRIWLTPHREPKTLAFSEGSRVELLPETRARVNALSPHGAELLLERGTLHVAVVPHEDARWLLLAGPFSVRVTGTQFKLSWAPEVGQLVLKMTEGSVMVDGPNLEQPRIVVGGEEFRISASESSPPTSPHSANEEPVPSSDEAAPAAATSASLNPARPGLAGDPPSQSSQSTPPRDELGELLARADAARLSGRGDLAREALIEARQRHGVRSNTAYLLGKVCADQLNNTPEAARWFETYLREQPAGRLREQALGRLLTMGHGSTPVLEQRARAYLKDFPVGAYAPLARRLVDSGTNP